MTCTAAVGAVASESQTSAFGEHVPRASRDLGLQLQRAIQLLCRQDLYRAMACCCRLVACSDEGREAERQTLACNDVAMNLTWLYKRTVMPGLG